MDFSQLPQARRPRQLLAAGGLLALARHTGSQLLGPRVGRGLHLGGAFGSPRS